LFSFYRRLIRLRAGSPALRSGSYRALRSPRDVFAYVRETDGERYVIALNFGDRPRRVAIGGPAETAFSTEGERAGSALHDALDLAANEGVVARFT
jgi:glycosidase